MATFVDLIGAPYPSEYNGKTVLLYEGTSLLPVIRNEKSVRSKPIFWEWQHGRAVRDGRWKLVKEGFENPWSLYNMDADPSETKDLAQSNREIVTRMDSLFNSWKASVSLFDKKKNEKKTKQQ